MCDNRVELVGKIGSMALIDAANKTIDYNIFKRIGEQLKPGMIWVTSGATEIGRIDFIERNGFEIEGDENEVKCEYASQGQSILMQLYREYIANEFSVRQVLVEHQHFNNTEKRMFLKNLLLRSVSQNAIPIINYNDAVSDEENRKNEIMLLQTNAQSKIVECVDNDETAAQISCLVNAKKLLIYTSANGIYSNPHDEATLIERVTAKTARELVEEIDKCKRSCEGASRKGANGAKAKLEYIKEAVVGGTIVYVANAKYLIEDVLNGKAPCTRIGLNL